jgi:hypothetical protein
VRSAMWALTMPLRWTQQTMDTGAVSPAGSALYMFYHHGWERDSVLTPQGGALGTPAPTFLALVSCALSTG